MCSPCGLDLNLGVIGSNTECEGCAFCEAGIRVGRGQDKNVLWKSPVKTKATGLSLVPFTLLRRNPGTRRGGKQHCLYFCGGLLSAFCPQGCFECQIAA